MLFTQQVVHGLYRVERAEGYFHEDRVPVAHRAVPQARQFQRLQVLAVLRLVRDEARGLVHIAGQVELMSLIVAHGTNQVHGIEVRALLEHLLLLGVVHVYLRALQDLQGDGAVGVIGQERASARFAHVLHHAADTHRAVQFLLQVDDQFGVFQVLHLGVLAMELLLEELKDFQHLLVRVLAAVQQLEVGKSLLLETHQHTGNDLLVEHRIAFQLVGHYVVYVLDEDDICIQVVQVLYQCAVPARTEEQLAVVAEGLVVHVGGDGVGAGLLLGERDIIVHPVTLGIDGGCTFTLPFRLAA